MRIRKFRKNDSRDAHLEAIDRGDRAVAALLTEKARILARVEEIDKIAKSWQGKKRLQPAKKKRIVKKRRKAVTGSRMVIIREALAQTPGLTIEAILAKLKKAGYTFATRKPLPSLYNQINAKGSGIRRENGRYFLTKAKGKKRDGGQEG